LPDGSTTLAFDVDVIDKADIDQGLMLPGWDVSYKPDELKSLLPWSRIHGRRHLVAPRRCGTYARSRGLHWRHTKPESGPQQSRARAYEYEWVICNTLDSCRSSLSSWRSVVSAPRRHNRTFTCVRPKRIGPTGRSSRVNVSVK